VFQKIMLTGIRQYYEDSLAGQDVSVEASCAKMFASEAVGRIADRNVQVHGGNGYIRDYRAEQLYRDGRLFRIY
jgi:acyl-CoA dehydrogenase